MHFDLGTISFMPELLGTLMKRGEFLEVGFEYVTGDYDDGGKIFSKRK